VVAGAGVGTTTGNPMVPIVGVGVVGAALYANVTDSLPPPLTVVVGAAVVVGRQSQLAVTTAIVATDDVGGIECFRGINTKTQRR
jgi:hypothetical protein